MTDLQHSVVLVTGRRRPRHHRGPLLSSSLDDVRSLFETNAFGPMAVAQAFAPC